MPIILTFYICNHPQPLQFLLYYNFSPMFSKPFPGNVFENNQLYSGNFIVGVHFVRLPYNIITMGTYRISPLAQKMLEYYNDLNIYTPH